MKAICKELVVCGKRILLDSRGHGSTSFSLTSTLVWFIVLFYGHLVMCYTDYLGGASSHGHTSWWQGILCHTTLGGADVTPPLQLGKNKNKGKKSKKKKQQEEDTSLFSKDKKPGHLDSKSRKSGMRRKLRRASLCQSSVATKECIHMSVES